MAQQWGVVVPVKLLGQAKSRLSTLGDDTRAELALAFAVDVVAAAAGCPRVACVLVVTNDARAAAALGRPGVEVVLDLPDAGLNEAFRHGAALLGAQRAELGVAALCADLPALRPEDLTAALDQVAERAFVADADGTGTTLLAAAPGRALQPSYGPGSRWAHARSGAARLAGAPSLRRDVDTPADLAHVQRLGVGAATAAVLARLPELVEVLYATVVSYDGGCRGGTVLLDDGSTLRFGPGALADDVRLLRSGQRVRLRLTMGLVRAVTLAGLPF